MPLSARPKPPAHHKKVQAGHHRKSKHYVKAYWPYLPMLLIIGLGFVMNSFISSGQVLGAQTDFSAAALLQSTNQARQEWHEPTLQINQQLQAAAQAKATDMAAKNYWSHNGPDGSTPWSFINSSGYQYQAAGENLAYGFNGAESTIDGWLSSPEHRANLLGESYQQVGFGIVQARDYLGKGPQTIVVAEYGQPTDSSTQTTGVPNNLTQSNTAALSSVSLPSKQVARVQQWSADYADWSMLAVTTIAALAAAVFIVRHSLQIHRLLSRGEAFMVHHPYIDIGVVMLCVAAVLLTRISGTIL